MPEGQETIRVACATCARQHNNHRVLHEVVNRFSDGPEGPPLSKEYHRFVECMGCESLKYVMSRENLTEVDSFYSGETDFRVYPDLPGVVPKRNAGFDSGEAEFPANVWKMYSETLQALNAGIRTLAAGGLRATVEAICLENGLTSGSLAKKIDELAAQNLLTSAQAELLHEERYLGNAALHELETPASHAIEDGLQIVEGLMNTIYILPMKAARLRKAREEKSD
ncbi:MAG: hypothetical protein ACI93T_003667 [Porticoccaceae bacterium]|jgi:hypothetical protein